MAAPPVKFSEPPVREVALTVYFGALADLGAIKLSALRERWRSEYPHAEEAFPERPRLAPVQTSDLLPLNRPVPPQVVFSNDTGDFVSIQADRMTRRWLFGGDSYPGFEALSKDLSMHLDELKKVIESELGEDQELVTTGASCEYVNEFNGVAARDLAVGLLTGWEGRGQGSPASYIGMHMHYGDSPQFEGCSVTWHIDGSDDEDTSVFVLEVLADEQRPDEVLGGLQRAHDVLVDQFLQLTTEEQHRSWGRHDDSSVD